MALTKIDDRGLKTPIDLLDNEKIRFGTGNDLEIYHNGSASYIKDAGTGDFNIISNTIQFSNAANDEFLARFVENGSAELYYNNSKKLNTETWGVEVIGTLRADVLNLLDSQELKIGDAADLQIYHDGTHTYVNNTTGDLRITDTGGGGIIIGTDSLALRNSARDENYLTGNVNGAVELYYDNVKKFETLSDGVKIDGILHWAADNSGRAIELLDNQKIFLGDGTDLQIFHDGGHSYIKDTGTGNLNLVGSIIDITNAAEDEFQARFIENGAVELYHNGNKTFQTNDDGIIIQAKEGGDANLFLYADEGDDNADKWLIQSESDGYFALKNYTSGSWEFNIKATGNGAVELYHDNSRKVYTYSSGVGIDGTLWIPDGSASGNRISIGDSADLLIYHNGSSSYINESSSGSLWIGGDSVIISRQDNSEYLAKFTVNGAADLYYDGVKKLETIANGVQTNGSHFVMDGDGANGNPKFACGNGADLNIYHDGSTSVIKSTSHPIAHYADTRHHFLNPDGSENVAVFTINGANELYYDGSKKFETQANGVTVFGSEGLKLYTENGNNTDTNSIVWRGGSDSQQANVAQLVAKQVSDWGGELQLKVKKNDGGLSDNYAMVLHAKGDSGGHINLCQDSVARFQVNGSGFKTGAAIPGNHETGGMIVNSGGESSLYRSSNGIVFIIGGPQSGQKLVEFRHTSTGIGNISKNGTTGITFNTTNSDRTLKKNFEDWTDSYWTGFKDLKPQKFNFLFQEDSEPKLKGYIAQDLASTFPEAYPKDAETDKYMFNPSGMVPYLMKTLQEAIAKIETLESKVAALESS